jgi:hypothetical protein
MEALESSMTTRHGVRRRENSVLLADAGVDIRAAARTVDCTVTLPC